MNEKVYEKLYLELKEASADLHRAATGVYFVKGRRHVSRPDLSQDSSESYAIVRDHISGRAEAEALLDEERADYRLTIADSSPRAQ